MYSKVGRLFIKEEKKQVVDCGGPKQADGEQWEALVVAVGVMREEGITVDEVMDGLDDDDNDSDEEHDDDDDERQDPVRVEDNDLASVRVRGQVERERLKDNMTL